MQDCRATTRFRTGSYITDFNIGGKVALPEDMLDAIIRVHPTGVPIRRAMIFKLQAVNGKNWLHTHKKKKISVFVKK